jgi:hypothetical protein
LTTSVTLSAQPVLQFFDNSGNELAGGMLTTLVGGVPYPTWSEPTGVFQLPNPVVLNARGEVCTATGTTSPLYVQAGVAYTYILQDAQLNTIWTQNNITSPLTGSQVLALLTQSLIGGTLWPQTTAEQAANVTPTNFAYQEGDIRRYGASISATTNHTFINAALTVSAAGGNATYIPGGTWPITTNVTVPPLSSMYGAGSASNILTSACDGLQFVTSDPGIVATSRFFRDFQITGTIVSGTNTNHGILINAGVISGVLFSNISILNFQYGIEATGLYYSTIFACFIQNCFNGIYFNNQSINVYILDCTIQLTSAGTVISGPSPTSTSIGIGAAGSPEVEGLHIQGGSIYGYNYDINLGLIFEVQIDGVDISNATICPIYFTSTIGGLEITNCWIELGPTASGTSNNKNSLGDGNIMGIYITAVAPENYAKVHITHNDIVCDQVFLGGSTGIFIGNDNNGIIVEANNILNFDVGIAGGNPANASGPAITGGSIKHNQITANSASIKINSLSSELDLGPNYIISGGQVAFNAGAPVSMLYSQPNAPMSGEAAFVAATTATVTFANALPLATYKITFSQSGTTTSPPWWTSKSTTGFTINMLSSFSGDVDWTVTF